MPESLIPPIKSAQPTQLTQFDGPSLNPFKRAEQKDQLFWYIKKCYMQEMSDEDIKAGLDKQLDKAVELSKQI